MKPLHEELGRAGDEQGRQCLPDRRQRKPQFDPRLSRRARANARSVRTALTLEAWEAINGAWLDVQKFGTRLESREQLVQLLDTVKVAMLVFDGAAHRTMLRGDAYWFIQLGAAIERADNTARLLDVKYHLLLPHGESVGGGLDYFQWTTILRTVSALTAYRWVYRDAVQPLKVADLLILNTQIPRSLTSCYQEIPAPARPTGRRPRPPRTGAPARRARAGVSLKAPASTASSRAGCTSFSVISSAKINRLGNAIAEQYLF